MNPQPTDYKSVALPLRHTSIHERVLIGSTHNSTSTNEAERPSLPPLFILPLRRSCPCRTNVAPSASRGHACHIRDCGLPFQLGWHTILARPRVRGSVNDVAAFLCGLFQTGKRSSATGRGFHLRPPIHPIYIAPLCSALAPQGWHYASIIFIVPEF